MFTSALLPHLAIVCFYFERLLSLFTPGLIFRHVSLDDKSDSDCLSLKLYFIFHSAWSFLLLKDSVDMTSLRQAR